MDNNNWPEVVGNLIKVRWGWVQFLRILGREGADAQTPGRFCSAIVQAILIFVSDTWAMTPCIVSTMGGFRRRVSQSIAGKKPQK